MDYQQETKHNESKLMEAIRLGYPELHILATQLQQSKVNPMPLFFVIKHMAEIAAGSRYGQVHILIEDGIVRFVKGEHQTKVNEPVLANNIKD